MEHKEEFDVYLLSNSSMDIYPDNTMAHFRNILSDELSLPGKWQVALTEITFPAVINNITSTDAWKYVINMGDRLRGVSLEGDQFAHFSIDAGRYPTVDLLLEEIKNKSGVDFNWSWNPVSRKVTYDFPYATNIQFGSRYHRVEGDKNIPSVLGLDGLVIGHVPAPDFIENYDPQNPRVTTESAYPVDLHAGRHLMFVNINIIDTQHVGNTKVPTLRIVPLLGKMRNDHLFQGQAVCYRTFEDLQFKNMLGSTVHRIEVELRDEMGHLIPFSGSGRTAITLKFRKISNI